MSGHTRWGDIKGKAGREFLDEKIHWLEGYIAGLRTVITEVDLNWVHSSEEQDILNRMRGLVAEARETLQILKAIPKE